MHKKNLNTLVLVSDNFFESASRHDSSIIEISFRQLISLALSDSCVHIDLRSCLAPHLLFVYITTLRLTLKPGPSLAFAKLLQTASFYSLLNQHTWRYSRVSDFSVYNNLSLQNISDSAYIPQKLLGFNVQCGNREVTAWDQPLLSYPIFYFTLIYALVDSVPFFLVSFNLGPGSRNEPELFPTFVDESDCIDNYLSTITKSTHVHSSFQTEEGGRFYRRKNSHTLIEVSNFDIPEIYSEYRQWLDIHDLYYILHHTQLCSIELRSILFVLFAQLLKAR